MATRQQAERELEKLGFQLDPDSGKSQTLGWSATIDPIGRMSIGPDCRGQTIANYTASSSAFWDEVIGEARDIAPLLAPCPLGQGECDYHDPEKCEVSFEQVSS